MTVRPARLSELVAALGAGRETPSSAVDRCCDVVDAVDGSVAAFLAEPDRRARLEREAADLADRYGDTADRSDRDVDAADRPPLYGVPVAVKDVFRVDGFPTRAGSALPPAVLGGPQAPAVTRLLEAGALVLGKTATTEFAYFAPGPTRNPHDPAHTPGGSSSGSAAAVAAGMCPLALGTQTAGSVLRPAAFCGVVGFKPTYGRVPTDGVIPLAPSLDTVGTFTQDVAGARLAAAVLCDDWRGAQPGRRAGSADGRSGRSGSAAAGGRPTLGVPDGAYLDRASTVGRARFAAQVDRLEDAGYAVVHTGALAAIDAVEADHRTLMAAEAALVHHDWFEAYGDRYAPATADLVREGRAVTVEALAAARAGRDRLRASIEASMAEHGVDGWVAPSAPGPAPEGLDSTGDPIMDTPWTYAGLPAVSVPAGEVAGLPLGLQSVGAFGADERLLRWAGPIAEVVAGGG